MKRQLIRLLATVLALVFASAMPVSARVEMPLTIEESTVLISGEGDIFYTPEGAVQLTSASENGMTVAVEIGQPFNYRTVSYLQLSVQSEVPFNIALKIDGAEHDLFPQLAGPSWYEAFQERAPGDGEGVAAGSYAFSLDLKHYLRYNELEAPDDGFTTLQKVYITVKGVGSLLVHHLRLSDTADFVAVNGDSGTAVTNVTAITTATVVTTAKTYATYGPGGVNADQDNGTAKTMVFALAGGAVIVALMGVMTLFKKRKPKPLYDGEFDDVS